MRRRLCGKLHGGLSQVLFIGPARHRSSSPMCLPHLHSTPPLGGSLSEYCHDVWYRKTRMGWLFDGEKNFEDMFIRFDRIHERDGRTPHDGIGRAYT